MSIGLWITIVVDWLGDDSLWLDSGYVDYKGNPIFISLLNSMGNYTGYYFGVANDLMKR